MALQKPDAAQIRAAISLLNWENADLARECGITSQSVSNIKRGVTRPQPRVFASIIKVLESRGIEFLDNSGVRFRPQGVEILTGQDGQHQFFDNVYDHMRLHGGTIVQFGIDEKQFTDIAGDEYATSYNKRMSDLVKKRKDIRVLAILREGDINFTFSEFNQYRWISKHIFAPVPFYIYGDNLAIMDFQTDPAPTIIVQKFPAIAQAYRKQFDVFWQLSRAPNTSEKETSSKK